LRTQVVAAQSPDYSLSDQQLNAVFAAMTAMQPADAFEGMVGAQLVAIRRAKSPTVARGIWTDRSDTKRLATMALAVCCAILAK
jgi:hypothetical protein